MIKVLKNPARRYAEAPVEPECREFGQYFQENAVHKTPISWAVLAKDDDKLLLLSRYALDYRQFHHECVPVTWENSDLRAWLNTSFLEEAFSEEERTRIVLTVSANPPDPKYGNSGGNDTSDYVFCLSSPEVSDLLESENEAMYNVPAFPVRQCAATPYACGKGAHNDSIKGFTNWWLRTPGAEKEHALFINEHGILWGMSGEHRCSVRPALWITAA